MVRTLQISKKKEKTLTIILSIITCLQKIRQIARLLSDLLPQMTIFKSLRFEIIDGATAAMNLECLFKFQVLYLRICTVIFFHDLQNKDLFYEKKCHQLIIRKYLRMFRTCPSYSKCIKKLNCQQQQKFGF